MARSAASNAAQNANDARVRIGGLSKLIFVQRTSPVGCYLRCDLLSNAASPQNEGSIHKSPKKSECIQAEIPKLHYFQYQHKFLVAKRIFI